jgi:hypothetical protein
MREHHVDHFKICPWSVALKDERIGQWLLAYGMIERWGKWPPGPDDPQFLEAMTVIANENNRTISGK